MRRVLAETTNVRAGDLVRISLRLKKGQTQGRITVWARSGEWDFSPYIDERRIEASNNSDKPQFLAPMAVTLSERRQHATVEFFSEIDQQFRVIQEIDDPSDAKVRARIRKYGKVATAFGRNLRNALRSIRGISQKGFWSKQ